MTKRAEIEQHYRLEGDRIMSPGKFEGELWWAPYVYEAWLEGDGDIIAYGEAVLPVSGIEAQEFDLASDTVAYLLLESDQGFVSVFELSKAELDNIKTEAEEEG